MHIVLAALGAIVTILILVKRLSDAGIDIGWLNPFAWLRRREWRKKYERNPAFSLSEPIEVAALLATTVVNIGNEIGRDEKRGLLLLFQNEFGRSEKEASELLNSSLYLLGDGTELVSKCEKMMENTLEKFSIDQVQSLMSLLNEAREIAVFKQTDQDQFIKKIQSRFDKHFNKNQSW